MTCCCSRASACSHLTSCVTSSRRDPLYTRHERSASRLTYFDWLSTQAHVQGIVEVKAVVVMIIDILDASGSFLSRVRNLVGPNPVIVVATKADLLPKGTNEERVQAWIEDFVAFKRLNCLSVHLVSNKTGANLPPRTFTSEQSAQAGSTAAGGVQGWGLTERVRASFRSAVDATCSS